MIQTIKQETPIYFEDLHEIAQTIERLGLPQLHETEGIPPERKMARLRFSHFMSGWEAYAVEYDPIPWLFFGLVKGVHDQWAYFRLVDLPKVKQKVGSFVWIDWSFKPTMAGALLN